VGCRVRPQRDQIRLAGSSAGGGAAGCSEERTYGAKAKITASIMKLECTEVDSSVRL
jgi:hypothetical protein